MKFNLTLSKKSTLFDILGANEFSIAAATLVSLETRIKH